MTVGVTLMTSLLIYIIPSVIGVIGVLGVYFWLKHKWIGEGKRREKEKSGELKDESAKKDRKVASVSRGMSGDDIRDGMQEYDRD